MFLLSHGTFIIFLRLIENFGGAIQNCHFANTEEEHAIPSRRL